MPLTKILSFITWMRDKLKFHREGVKKFVY
jgi:hypothetical protein